MGASGHHTASYWYDRSQHLTTIPRQQRLALLNYA